MKYCGAAIVLTLWSVSLAQTRLNETSHAQKILNTPINCHGLSQTTLMIEDGEPKSRVQKSADEMRIIRHNRTLSVTVNGKLAATVDPKIRKALQEPDVYTITSDVREGLAAIHGDPTYPTIHTLVIDSTGTKVLWTESSLSWSGTPAMPTSTTVMFACAK